MTFPQLTEEGCRGRRERLWSRLPEDIEWCLIGDARHIMYLANFWLQPMSFSNGERVLLLLERSGKATLIGDNFTTRSAATQAHVDDWAVYEWYTHKKSTINRDHAIVHAFRDHCLATCQSGRGMVENESVPGMLWFTFMEGGVELEDGELNDSFLPPGETARDVGALLRSMRRQKDPDEVDVLRACMKAGEAGHDWARENVRPGATELDLYLGVARAAQDAAGGPAIVYGSAGETPFDFNDSSTFDVDVDLFGRGNGGCGALSPGEVTLRFTRN